MQTCALEFWFSATRFLLFVVFVSSTPGTSKITPTYICTSTWYVQTARASIARSIWTTGVHMHYYYQYVCIIPGTGYLDQFVFYKSYHVCQISYSMIPLKKVIGGAQMPRTPNPRTDGCAITCNTYIVQQQYIWFVL